MTWPGVRDAILFAAGLAGIGYETLSGKPVSPELLLLFAAMCGLPSVLRKDEKDRDK
jgi:hypothetical protein